ncbi:restriction endonuclease subunit S [Microbacterium sp. M3]|uniref:Restriction endonuclease subunit S n=1 Tax=Microbacterium arthrosphaerae TaxID=792652 RepID=A0ABU4GYE6_9MICO|nr:MULTISPECIES: restriction endonuclease subunit S [Microbacterium]MDW4572112.1 restriction endonuclease subunit S [Microbacterium arthrosphaerae]MDW7605967.1 restriction endonuclease subunit S [Microbacterium sp. M3]
MTWETVPLRDVVSSVATGFASRDDLEQGVFQIRMNNLTSDSRWDWSKRRRVAPNPRQLKSSSVAAGDVILNATNSPELVGKSGVMPALDEPAVISNHFLRLRTRREKLDAAYLQHWLLQQFLAGVFRARAKAWINQATLDREVLMRMELPLPSLSEQRRIAAILDQADALRRARRTASATVSALRASHFLEKFGSEQETDRTITDVLACEPNAIRTGPFGSDLLHSEFLNEGIPVLGIDNVVQNRFEWARPRFISEEKYDSLRRYTVRSGDVLISIMGTVGRCAVVPDYIGTAINTKHLCCITLDHTLCLPEYLHDYFLHHPTARQYLQRTSKGAIMDGLNMGIVKKLPLVLPSIERQKAYLSETAAISTMEARLASLDLDALFASLQHRAFRGEL